MKAPPSGQMADSTNLVIEQKSRMEQVSGLLRQLPGGDVSATYTLDAADTIKPIVSMFAVDSLGGAAADTLARIQGEDIETTPGLPDGSIVILRAASNSRVITVQHLAGGSGEISLTNASAFVLNSTKKRLVLERRAAQWIEIDRSYGGDAAAERAFLGLTLAATVPNPANPGDDGKAILASGGALALGTPVSSGGPLHRLLVSRTSDYTLGLADGNSYSHAQFNAITTESSPGALWDAVSFEVKIPVGVSFVRVKANLELGFTSAPVGVWWAEAFSFYRVSGGGYPGNPDGHSKVGLLATSFQGNSAATVTCALNGASGEIAVSSGDRLKLMVRGYGSGGGNQIKIRGAALPAYCWLSVEFFA